MYARFMATIMRDRPSIWMFTFSMLHSALSISGQQLGERECSTRTALPPPPPRLVAPAGSQDQSAVWICSCSAYAMVFRTPSWRLRLATNAAGAAVADPTSGRITISTMHFSCISNQQLGEGGGGECQSTTAASTWLLQPDDRRSNVVQVCWNTIARMSVLQGPRPRKHLASYSSCVWCCLFG